MICFESKMKSIQSKVRLAVYSVLESHPERLAFELPVSRMAKFEFHHSLLRMARVLMKSSRQGKKVRLEAESFSAYRLVLAQNSILWRRCSADLRIEPADSNTPIRVLQIECETVWLATPIWHSQFGFSLRRTVVKLFLWVSVAVGQRWG